MVGTGVTAIMPFLSLVGPSRLVPANSPGGCAGDTTPHSQSHAVRARPFRDYSAHTGTPLALVAPSVRTPSARRGRRHRPRCPGDHSKPVRLARLCLSCREDANGHAPVRGQ